MSRPRDETQRISAITPHERDPNARQVVVGDRVVATLRLADIEALGLAVGAEWTGTVADRVAGVIALGKARRDAMSIIARSSRSRSEVVDRLEGRGHARQMARDAADELVMHGWLDDEAVALETIAKILRKGPAAAALLQRRIEARGIDPGLAARVAEQAVAESDPIEAATTLARAVSGADGPASPALVRRIAGVLARRGFDADTVAVVLDRLGLARGGE